MTGKRVGWYLAALDDEDQPCRTVGGPWEEFDDIVWPDGEDGSPRYLPILVDPDLFDQIMEIEAADD